MCNYIYTHMQNIFLILHVTVDIYFVLLFVYSVAEMYKLSILQIVYNLMMELENKYIEI